MKFALHCGCGASWVGECEFDGTLSDIIDRWSRVHSGPGHSLVDARTAADARGTVEVVTPRQLRRGDP